MHILTDRQGGLKGVFDNFVGYYGSGGVVDS